MTLPNGFISGSIAAGLKNSGALDLTIIQNIGPDKFGTAVYTTNKVVAAPVIWSRQVTKSREVSAAVLNSGGANACTGSQGFADTHKTAELIAEKLGISAGEVVVCSTGLIGEFLPMEKIATGISKIELKADGFENSARAIMTTDSVPKMASATFNGVTVSGIAKGAGMLAPALATMLSVVMTDAVVDPDEAEKLFNRAVELSYNRIDSDGCTSTNDTVLLMASGSSGVKLSSEQLGNLLNEVCGSLSAQLIADAEGSSKTVAIKVINAATESDAVNVGRANARNNLLKCAIFGGDPNWGRVLAATGTAEANFDALNIDVKLNGIQVCKASAPDQDKTLVNFDNRLVEIEINLNAGKESAIIYTNDLSHDYVHENSAYST
jgi:glutamate N-acetyltransferase/amino-acid N-acetyltransferase